MNINRVLEWTKSISATCIVIGCITSTSFASEGGGIKGWTNHWESNPGISVSIDRAELFKSLDLDVVKEIDTSFEFLPKNLNWNETLETYIVTSQDRLLNGPGFV